MYCRPTLPDFNHRRFISLVLFVLDAQTQNGDEPVGEITYPGAKLPF